MVKPTPTSAVYVYEATKDKTLLKDILNFYNLSSLEWRGLSQTGQQGLYSVYRLHAYCRTRR